MTHKGIAKGKTIELEKPLPYADGQPVSVEVEPLCSDLHPGSPATILNVVRGLPTIDPKDVDVLEQVIEQSKLPVRTQGVFAGNEPENER